MRLGAERWMGKAFPGCPIPIDAGCLRFWGRKRCRFPALERFSRPSSSQACSSASSACARAFLEEGRRRLPFSFPALQTDCGAELLKRFHRSTEEEPITRHLSRPYSSRENACGERRIQTEGYEPWAFGEGYTAEELHRILDGCNQVDDHVLPHQSLGCLTPMEFLKSWREEGKDRDGVSTMW